MSQQVAQDITLGYIAECGALGIAQDFVQLLPSLALLLGFFEFGSSVLEQFGLFLVLVERGFFLSDLSRQCIGGFLFFGDECFEPLGILFDEIGLLTFQVFELFAQCPDGALDGDDAVVQRLMCLSDAFNLFLT